MFSVAKHNADSRSFVVELNKAVKVVHIHLQLPYILMLQFPYFQVYKNKTPQRALVKYEVHKEVLFIEGKALLSAYEEKAFSKLKEIVLDLIDDTLCVNIVETPPL